MSRMNRRQFMKNSLVASAGAGLGLNLVPGIWSKALGANEDIRIAIAGLRNQGNSHKKGFAGMSGVRIVALCDPDQHILDERHKGLVEPETDNEGNTSPGYPHKVDKYTDIRQVLDRKDIDAIVIATPNHWHALATVWACQAGKHVYVEKPVSHTIWEGRKMIEAARKYNRIVQAGTQQRSCPAVKEAAADIQAGKYGKALWAHTSRLGARESIGYVTEPQPVPDYIDYELWAGPAPKTPVMRKQFHYDWHWQWNWGNGELGNWGVHYIDDLRHLLGWDSVPTSVIAAGNRFAWHDNGQTPNMQFALMNYDGMPIVADIRNLPDPSRPEGKRGGGSQGAVYRGSRGGNYIRFEKGIIRMARGGGWAYDLDDKRVYQYKGDGGKAHRQNFLDAIRSGRKEDLNADIEHGHFGALMCHLGNISYQLGSTASVEQVHESMKSHEDALYTLTEIVEQIEGNQVNLKKTPLVLGPKLTFERKTERFTGNHAEAANAFLKPGYREHFVMPEQV